MDDEPGTVASHPRIPNQDVPNPRVLGAIGDWRDSLVNLAGTNRLLNFKPSRSSTIEIVQPGAAEVLAALTSRRTLPFRSIAPPTDPPEVQDYRRPLPVSGMLDTLKNEDELVASLRLLARRSKQEYLDRGVWVLYVAVGMLRWSDDDGNAYASPLLLVPVQLVRSGLRQVPVLEPADEDPLVNPALALRLSLYGITLPTVDLLDDLSLDRLLDQVRAATSERSTWQVDSDVVLSCFSFHKEAMYRDLIENQHAISQHPVVAALALGGNDGAVDTGFDFDAIPDERIDLDAPPEKTPLVLDADAWQRACVAAAVEGRSFVMDGPPGTGKSQTIANMIGVLLHAGKTVLFVSEKAAALEVVRNRLNDVGLGSYVLELHSHKATRREVAAALGGALDTIALPPTPMSALALAKVAKRREELSAYAEAMNAPRPPLDYSVHDVLGMIAQLDGVPVAPATGIAPVDLTVEVLEEIRTTAVALAGAWRPAAQGTSYPWRGVTETAPMDAQLYEAAAALDRLVGLSGRNTALMEALGLQRTSDAERLADVLDHLAAKPAHVPDDWLTVPSMDEIHGTVTRLASDLATVDAAVERTEWRAGVGWRQLPDSMLDLAAVGAPGAGELTAADAMGLAESHLADAARVSAGSQSVASIASVLGLPRAVTYADATETLAVAAIGYTADRPERAWLTPDGLAGARKAAGALRDARRRVEAAESAARRYFIAEALRADVAGLARRFARNTGARKLLGEYRADRHAVAALAAGGVRLDDAIQQLALAHEWQSAATEYAAVAARYADRLGSYYTGPATDEDRLARALANAELVVRRGGPVIPPRLTEHVSVGGSPHPTLSAAIADTRRDLDDWAVTALPELLDRPLADAAAWLGAEATRLAAAAELGQRTSEAVGRTLTIADAAEILAHRREVVAALDALAERAPAYAAACGELFDGERTDAARVHAALTWAERARALLSGVDVAFTPVQVKALGTAVATPALRDAAGTWSAVVGRLLGAFDASRRTELARELDDYTDAADLIAVLRADPAGKDEWFTYVHARAALAARGLDVAVEFCISERLPTEVIPQVIVRAVLHEWADHHLSRDPILRYARVADLDDVTAEFSDLDKALVGSAVSDIVRAVNGRRPRNDIGQAAIIQREASKKKKHMPVRTLIERTRHVVQAIKPCFMMSPLSVSQYLPADLTFDVVIFDEASQLMPGDAINCIYRGRALVTAGDQNQLPPTTFFTPTTDDPIDDWSDNAESARDFESILDLVKASGVFKSLGLRWHYRSRHEGLISFSNMSFYNGSLITFPGAEHDGGDVGVELFTVDGVYRRGTTRDNLIEAAKVAERVIHHYDTRPGLTLGVVTFSEAQAAAVEFAVEQARLDRPDLDQFFTDDRLGGFFVKNLESVQGDERDVMIFSVGYGPDESGKVTMNFGPLNRPGGWRRLNVAITRARYRVEIVSSITAEHISETIRTEGVQHLRRYLDYAARGLPALDVEALETRREATSPLESSVIETIRSWGYETTARVGVAGYRIDVGVHHPTLPGVYLLGVECDGLAYYSSKAARDRDRLRGQVLRGLGWRLHRIWSTAWHRDRAREEARLRAAIESALAGPAAELPGSTDGIERPPVALEAIEPAGPVDWAVPYETAAVDPLPSWVDVSDVGAHYDMRPGIERVVAVESPVHVAVVHQRLREAWNIGRVGARIRDNIDSAIRHSDVVLDGDFVVTPDRDRIVVRTPTERVARTVEQVHDAEIAAAAVNFVRDAGGIGQAELISAVVRLFGWGRRRSEAADRIGNVIRRLRAEDALAGESDALTLPATTVRAVTP